MASVDPRLHASRLLHLGCGLRMHPAWVHLDLVAYHPDVVPCDFTRGLPPACEGRFDAVYHAHVLEHLPHRTAPAFLRACHDALVPGGWLRVVVPDLEAQCRVYLEALARTRAGEPGADADHRWMVTELVDALVRETSGGEAMAYLRADPGNLEFLRTRLSADTFEILERERGTRATPQAVGTTIPEPDAAERKRRRARDRLLTPEERAALDRDGFRRSGERHAWMYDRISLRRLLEESGFVDIGVTAPDESRIPDFATFGLERDEAGREHRPDSLYMEARRPTS